MHGGIWLQIRNGTQRRRQTRRSGRAAVRAAISTAKPSSPSRRRTTSSDRATRAGSPAARRSRMRLETTAGNAKEGNRSRWGGRTSNPVGAAGGPAWVRLPLSSATILTSPHALNAPRGPRSRGHIRMPAMKSSRILSGRRMGLLRSVVRKSVGWDPHFIGCDAARPIPVRATSARAKPRFRGGRQARFAPHAHRRAPEEDPAPDRFGRHRRRRRARRMVLRHRERDRARGEPHVQARGHPRRAGQGVSEETAARRTREAAHIRRRASTRTSSTRARASSA